jgi:hypothetical protein
MAVEGLAIFANVRKEVVGMKPVERCRLMSIRRYFILRLQGVKKLEASEMIARDIWSRGPRFARRLREWSRTFLEQGQLKEFRQGMHPKTTAVISDEDLTDRCREFIRSQVKEQRSPMALKQFVEEILFPEVFPDVEFSISESTCQRYMHLWGFAIKDTSAKNVYVDGHEREDVVSYREEWAKRMLGYQRRMADYKGEHLELMIDPSKDHGISEETYVLVTHDETYFYSNDCKTALWLTSDESIIRKKGQGRAIMVSAFGCSCHGLFSLKQIVPGANADGYWKKEDMQRQLIEAIAIFRELHETAIGIFCFDQSSNHAGMPDDGLSAYHMNLKPGGKQRKMRSGWFLDQNRVKITQPMQVDDVPRGLTAILRERGLWPERGLRLQCSNNQPTTPAA